MANEETLSAYLERIRDKEGHVLIVTRKQPAKDLAKTIHALLPGSYLLEPETLTPDELEAFLSKRTREEGGVIATLTAGTPERMAGYLNQILETRRLKVSGPASWETIALHPKFRITVVAEQAGLSRFQNLIKKTSFTHRHYVNRLLERI